MRKTLYVSEAMSQPPTTLLTPFFLQVFSHRSQTSPSLSKATLADIDKQYPPNVTGV